MSLFLPISACRLAYHQACGGKYYPLGEETDATKHVFALAVPECQQSGVTAAKSFPLLLPQSQQDEEHWTAWCIQEQFVSAAPAPQRFFQTGLWNVAKSTRVHSKKADVLEQALIILHACMLDWVTARAAGIRTACQVIAPATADLQHLSASHQAALLDRFQADVVLLTGAIPLINSSSHYRHFDKVALNMSMLAGAVLSCWLSILQDRM